MKHCLSSIQFFGFGHTIPSAAGHFPLGRSAELRHTAGQLWRSQPARVHPHILHSRQSRWPLRSAPGFYLVLLITAGFSERFLDFLRFDLHWCSWTCSVENFWTFPVLNPFFYRVWHCFRGFCRNLTGFSLGMRLILLSWTELWCGYLVLPKFPNFILFFCWFLQYYQCRPKLNLCWLSFYLDRISLASRLVQLLKSAKFFKNF